MIIGMTGSISAGKETLTKFFIEKGFKYYVTSDILKDELKRRGENVTRENMQNLGDRWREEQGAGVLMKMLLEKINREENSIIDSLRNPKEAEFLRENLDNFLLIAVDADRNIRFKRIIERGKPSDPKTWKEFLVVDERDLCDTKNPLGQQVRKCIEMSDKILTNNGTLEEFQKKVKNLYEEIIQ